MEAGGAREGNRNEEDDGEDEDEPRFTSWAVAAAIVAAPEPLQGRRIPGSSTPQRCRGSR